MDVVAWSHHLDHERAAAIGVRRVEPSELWSTSDVLSVHLRLGKRSAGLVGAAELAAMKPSAFLVNTSRGEIVDGAALVDALKSGAIAGAAVDVYDAEPLSADNPLLSAPNVVLSPHVGYVTEANLRLFYKQTLEDIEAFLAGAPIRVVRSHDGDAVSEGKRNE
jgi:phosphoglycerate dehydrogenase-like enzyme